MILLNHTHQQVRMTTRNQALRQRYETYAYDPETTDRFKQLYQESFGPLMFWWALVGGLNVHRSLIIILSLCGRFDLYLAICTLIMIPMLLVNSHQKEKDEQLQSLLERTFPCPVHPI